jgi:hypothetical protein
MANPINVLALQWAGPYKTLIIKRKGIDKPVSGLTNSLHVSRPQEIAVKLDKMYKLSEEENGRLRAQFKCQEDDREYLIRQVRLSGWELNSWNQG